MPTGQQYATNVPQTFITGLIHPTDNIMSVNSSAGWPSVFPFTAILEIGTSLQEPIDVTNISGTTWTITRAIDGTVGFTHNPNATVTHGDIGRDFRESRSHIDASTSPDAVGHDVHGIGSGNAIMGTGTAQAVTNKAFGAGNTYTANVNMGGVSWGGSGPLSEASLAVTGITGAQFATARLAGTTTAGGPPVSGAFNTGDMVEDQLYGTLWICTAGGSPCTWVPVAGEVNVSETTLVAPAASMSATIPSWAKTFRVTWSGRSAAALTNTMVQFNGDTASNYLWQEVQAENAASTAANSGGATTSLQVGVIPGSGSTANYFGSGDFVVANSAGAVFKTVVGKSIALNTTADSFVGVYGGQWNNTAAITSILLKNGTGNFVTGSTMTVYAGT